MVEDFRHLLILRSTVMKMFKSPSIRARSPFAPLPATIVNLIGSSSPRTLTLAFTAVLLAWVPAVILSALQGSASLQSFLTDFAAQSRLLVAIPLLIIADPFVRLHLDAVARHFLEADFITANDRSIFQIYQWRCERMWDSKIVRIVLLVLTYLFALGVTRAKILDSSLMGWCIDDGTRPTLSPAGLWYVFVSNPILLFLLLNWLWKQGVWALFLRSIAQMNLQLVPAHPDLVGGLSFVEYSTRTQFIFSFVVGLMVAGGVANRVIHQSRPLLAYKYSPLLTIVVVLALCIGPVFVFARALLVARRRGVFEYGALAHHVGTEFEKKWLQAGTVGGDSLGVPDFSATTDLYSITANVTRIKAAPISIYGINALIVSALVPMGLVILAVLPFDVIFKEIIKLVL